MKRMVMFSQDIGMWNGGANSLMLKVLLLPFLEYFHLLLLNPLSLLMLPLPLPPRMLSLQQKLRALLLKTWEKILMLFLPYLNGQKKLLPIKEIPKPLLRNLSPTTLMTKNCSDIMRTTLLILRKIDTICLTCTMAKNATMFTYWWNSTIVFHLWWWCFEKKILHLSKAFGHTKITFGKLLLLTFTIHYTDHYLLRILPI